MNKSTKFLLLIASVIWLPFSVTYAQCDGWKVQLLHADTSLCMAQTLSFDVLVHNDAVQLDSCQYAWFVQTPMSSDFSLYATAQTMNYHFSIPGEYRLYATARPNDCGIIQTTAINITLYPPLTNGVISGIDTICCNATPQPLRQIVAPTGGDNTFTYQWESKTTGEWQPIANATNTTYRPNALATTTRYRLRATASCGEVFSNEIEIYVYQPLAAPIIYSNEQIVCYNSAPNPLTVSSIAQCDVYDSISYQWQQRTTGDWENIIGATSQSYQPKAITIPHQYRVLATSFKGCGTIASNTLTIDVYSPLQVMVNDISPICSYEQTTLNVSATGAGEQYAYQWQESSDGVVFTDISAATAATYTTSPKVGGNYTYRCIVSPIAGCRPDTSRNILLTVYDTITSGSIIGVDTICYGTIPHQLQQIKRPTGGDGVFAYWWEYKTTNGWHTINDATDTLYQPEKLLETTYYRLRTITSCGEVISNEVEIYVCQNPTAPVINSEAETICYGFAPDEIVITSLAGCDSNDSITYQWQQRTTGDWENIIGATAHTYQPLPITTSHQYRVLATSMRGCGQVFSNTHTVNVYNNLQISTHGVSPLCYMTRDTISVTATGDGDSYTYQWQDSTDGIWTDILGENMPQLLTPRKTMGEYYYRCMVIPTLGCTPDTSDVIAVSVYDSIYPGVITLSGVDTICYGFIPDPISLSIPATGGDNSFTYRWLCRIDEETQFQYISDATSTTYAPPALYQSTEYQLEVTNNCDVRHTNIVRIYVRDDIKAPVLAEYVDTICYNTIPDAITISVLPTGGIDDEFSYQWLKSDDGISFTEIIGEHSISYQPSALFKKQFYRVRATSARLCGDILSNIVVVNVHDSLHITTTENDSVCYMSSATLSVKATGGGNRFQYQWQEKQGDTWLNIAGATSDSYTTLPRTEGNYFYRCIVSADKCEDYSRISPIIMVHVYEPLYPGTIVAGVDSTCYGYAPADMLRMDIAASGADGKYTYRWQYAHDAVWHDIIGEHTTSYQPQALLENTKYRLLVSSLCDTLPTNEILIRVNPLPQLQVLTGANTVCYNQHEIYSVSQLNNGFTYEWSLEQNNGELTTDALNTNTIDVLWKNPNTTDSVILRVTDNRTGCERNLKLGISICGEQAPERTIIVRKPNSNILVCKADGDWIYQWGYTDKSTTQETVIDDSNHRYVLLPTVFDTIAYDYWLVIRPSVESPCYSRTYYTPGNDSLITVSSAQISVPSFVKEKIPIVVQNPSEVRMHCAIYNLSGEMIATYSLGNESFISTSLPISFPAGMYIMHMAVGDYLESIKLIAQ